MINNSQTGRVLKIWDERVEDNRSVNHFIQKRKITIKISLISQTFLQVVIDSTLRANKEKTTFPKACHVIDAHFENIYINIYLGIWQIFSKVTYSELH